MALNQHAGELIVVRYNAGFIVLSYLVSLIGCVTTLELINRRTSRHGAYNWYLLITSSITMGGIGIWCMHFIGNRAIIMGEGQLDMQIVYNTGFTSVSFFLPIIVLSGAFYILGATGRVNRYYIASAGVLMGVAICSMHYVGQLGIANYHCSYQIGQVIGAAIISISASMVALIVFFRLRESWTDSWWKRVMCGLVLACAVSGMHWTATVGTLYRWKGIDSMPHDPLSRTQTVIVCTTLSCATCILLLLVALIAGLRSNRYRSRAQQIVLACGYFDDAGRIMVTTEGDLPNKKIANHYMDKTFSEEEFTRTHPAFVWAYRASHNWATIKSLIPGMKSHLQVTDSAALYHPKYYPSIFSTNRAYLDFSVIFKELFSIAALDLSNLIQQPLEALGTLYEEPIETGRHPRRPRSRSHSTISTSEMEAGGVELEKPVLPNFLSAGKFLFVIRHVDKNSVAELAAAGFRFAPLAQISNTLARSMELPAEELASRFRHMQAQNTSESMISPGVHLACFMLRPRLRQGFDILVPAKTQNQLPTVRLPYSELAPKQLEILDKMDNCTVGQIFERFEGNKGQDQNSEADFWRHFQRAMTSLVKRIGDRSIMQARFSARAIEAPCRPQSNTINAPKQCYLFSIHMISTIHTIAPNSDFSFIPLRSFSVQQQVYMGEADQEAFSRQAYLEFAHCFDSKDDECESSSKHSSHVAIIPIRPKDSQTSFQWPRSSLRRSDSGERRDSIVPASEKMPTVHSGPIVVSSQVTVETSGGIVRSSTAESEEQRMGTTGGASAVAIETETYVDYLFALCKR